MLPTDRISYSAITERPRLSLPDGARMVVWVIVNVEEWKGAARCRKRKRR
jgi:allantoinase